MSILESQGTIKKLLEILCCPECHGDLVVKGNGLHCKGCGAEYFCYSGMWKLIKTPKDLFIEEEKMLFDHMKRPKDIFSSEQWRKSKEYFIETVLKRVGDLSGKVALHVGCGVDEFVGYFNDCLFYFSSDITEEMLKEIDTKGARNKMLVNCNVEKLPFKTDSIDIILCIDLIHHFYSRGIEIPLGEIMRCLKHDGILFLEEVNKYALYRLPYCFVPLRFLNVLRYIKALYKKNYSKPASYEAPLSFFKVIAILKKISEKLNKRNFVSEVIPTIEYPSASKLRWQVYIWTGKIIPMIYKYFGYHWFVVFYKKDKY